jgi:hypothetical protein
METFEITSAAIETLAASTYLRLGDEAGARYDAATNETYRALGAVDTAQATLQAAKADLEQAIAEATVEAYANGAITGKNAEQRDAELKAHLGKLIGITARKMAVEDAEKAYRTAKLDLDRATNEMAFARHLVNLRVAQLGVVAS